MKDLVSNNFYYFIPLVSFYIISCGATMPLQEISTAKQEITRARLLNSERYAKNELEESKANLFLAHESTFQSKPDNKKIAQLAQASTEKAGEAIKKSLPNYVKDIQKEVEMALSSADSALAESLAGDIFEKATLLKIEGDELVKNADKKLAISPNDSSVYEDYEKGISRYKESIQFSEKAKDLSIAQTQAVIDSTSDIETNFDLIEKYSNKEESHKQKVAALRQEYKKSLELMESGNLKEGFKKSESIRISTNELITKVILPYAKDRIKLATQKIENAEKFLGSDSEKEKPSIASDNLLASKEAFNSSVDLLGKERYYDAIQQSDESIRLAEEIINSPDSKETNYSKRNQSKEEETEKEETQPEKDSYPTKKSSSKTSETTNAKNPNSTELPKQNTTDTIETKYKKYVVKKKIPPETLWKIAADKKYLGDKNRWKEIYNVNKKNISNPNLIYPNQILLIPTKEKKKSSK